MKRIRIVLSIGLVAAGTVVRADDWPQFRGLGGLGIAPEQAVPVKFDGKAGVGVLWKVKLDESGQSSPIVVGDKVFVTGGDKEKRFVSCYNVADGKLAWKQEVKWGKKAPKKKQGEEEESTEPELKDYVAANTPVSDGKRVYAAFGTGDVVAYDLAGKKVWAICLWPIESQYGFCASLALFKNKVIIQLDHGGESGSALIALDVDTGKQLWKTKRSASDSFQSPIVVETKTGPQIITATAGGMHGYNAETGAELWSADAGGTDDSPSPAYANGIMVAAHSGDQVYAVKTDGKGNVNKTHLAWTKEGPVEAASPVAKDNRVFVAHDGKLACYAVDTGKELWTQETSEKAYASLCVVGDKVFFIAQNGEGFVFKAADKFEELGKFNVGDGVDSTPAFANGKIFIRGSSYLWCFGTK
jgi:outer membrane protein assembly factor BamB